MTRDLERVEWVPGQLPLPVGEDVVDLFAGPGGWDEGMRGLGLTAVGIEWDRWACATARAAGHRRIRADVAALDPRRYASRGQVGSPPCQGFAAGGLRRGHGDAAVLLEAVPGMRWRDVRADVAPRMDDPRSVLVLEPLRWALAAEPEWLAWEQVPAVLPLWEACAGVLRAVGYDVATGILSAERYGVPQVRRRAFLVARRYAGAALPEPTHARYDPRGRAPADRGLLPCVTMAEALGWGMTGRPYPTVAPGTAAGGTDPLAVGGSGARDAVGRELDAGRWLPRPVTGDDDALTLFDVLEPCSGDRAGTAALRVTVREAGLLQGFRGDYPWSGTESAQHMQIGNAVPPPLARAVVAEVADADAPRTSSEVRGAS